MRDAEQSAADQPMPTRALTICNRRGLHARAAAKFVKTCEGFEAAVEVEKDGVSVWWDTFAIVVAGAPTAVADFAALLTAKGFRIVDRATETRTVHAQIVGDGTMKAALGIALDIGIEQQIRILGQIQAQLRHDREPLALDHVVLRAGGLATHHQTIGAE